MANVADYVKWRGDLSFTKSPFCDGDNIVLSEFTYLEYNEAMPQNFEDVVSIHDAMTAFFKGKDISKLNNGALMGNEAALLGDQLSKTHRYKNIKMTCFKNIVDNKTCEQFCATSFIISPTLVYIGIKGTDDNVVGWLEDFRMTTEFPVHSQKTALIYVKQVMDLYKEASFIIGGHSKGGNLAIYAMTYLPKEYQDRILHIYSNDGPGFPPKTIDLEKYKLIDDKVTHIIPRYCVVGNFFDDPSTHRLVVRASKKDINCHNGFYWNFDGPFLEETHLSKKSLFIKGEVAKLLGSYSKQDLKRIQKLLNDFMIKIKQDKVSKIFENTFKSLIIFLRTMVGKDRKLFTGFLMIMRRNKMM